MALPRKPDNVKTGKHSMNPDRGKPEVGSRMRTKSTIKRLNMYRNFKAKRDSKGKILRAAPFQGTMPSGTVSRVEPNRRWFGNTRVISQDALQAFKEAMKVKNPYEIMLRQTRLPISLLDEKKTKKKSTILSAESFADTFGKKAKRKRPRLSFDDLGTLVRDAIEGRNSYIAKNDHSLVKEDAVFRDSVSDPHFKAGTSKRLWNELFKVIDSSDVILYVLDARDPMGTRSKYIEEYMKKEKPNKHFIFVINKVDLVPVWITKRWKTILSAEFPTLVFYANLTKPLGKNALMGLLRQLASLHSKNRHQISVGIIGYPNVGKSSIINAMRSKKVCKVAPLAGETKVWQYVTLLKSIYLIDCPGVVYPEGATESEMVMKGVVRVEYLQEPELYITDVLARVKPEYLQQRYNLPDYDPTCHPLCEEKEAMQQGCTEQTNQKKEDNVSSSSSSSLRWPIDTDLFLELVSKKTGKLLKGGDPDLTATAKRVLNDFQRGKLPYFVRPPDPPATEKVNEDVEEEEQMVKEEESMVTDAEKSLLPKEDVLEEAFATAFNSKSTEVDESNCEESSDAESGAFNLEPDNSDEETAEPVSEKASTSHSANNQKSSLDGLSAARQRQLERALKRKELPAGRRFYKEANFKNRKHAVGGPLHGVKKKRSKRKSA